MKKTARQPSQATSTPPSEGPSAAATAPAALQIAVAVARRPGGVAASSSASEVGKRIAAPRPWTARMAETAADEAIAEFGPAGVVAAALQAELSAARARGIARRMFAAGPVLGRSGSPRWRHRW